jgi:hypothetical protein
MTAGGRMTRDEVLDAVARERGDADMNAAGAIPWSPDEPLWKSIAGETFEHWPQHSADVRRAAGTEEA